MTSWTYVERRNGDTLSYRGIERRSSRNDSGPQTAEHILIQRSIAHDRDAFVRLYDRYIDRIFKYIYLLVGDRPLAEDLTTQVFARAWQTVAAYPRSERPFAIWLYRLAYSVVRASWQAHPPAQPTTGAKSLPRAFSRLDEQQRQVLLLRFLEGYNVEHIAQITGESSETVRTLQYRALVLLSEASHTT